MGEEVNLFTQYSNLRVAKREEMEAAGASAAEIREALRFEVPALVRPPAERVEPTKTDDLHADASWDVADADGAKPTLEEAEAAVMGRLATHLQAFRANSEA